MIEENIFERLKNNSVIDYKEDKSYTPLFFQLKFHNGQAYLAVVDQQSKKEVEVDSRYYKGDTRSILKSIEKIQEKSSFSINWDQPENRVYFYENDALLWQLKKSNNFVDAKFKNIEFVEGEFEISLHIEGEEDLKCVVCLYYNDEKVNNLSVITEKHIFSCGRIYETQSLGENYHMIKWFETTFPRAELEKFLSLLFSHFDNINVKFEEYKQKYGQPYKVKPTMIFEKIDKRKSLHLNIGITLPGFDMDTVKEYDIRRIATLNEMEKIINIREVDYGEDTLHVDSFNKLLKKYSKELKGKPLSDFLSDGAFFVIEEELAALFIHRELPNLLRNFTVLGAEKLKSYKVHAAKPRLKLALNHGIDFLEGDASLEIDGQEFSLFDAINQYKKRSYILLNDGTHAIVNQSYIDKLTRIFKKEDENVKISFFDLPLVEDMIDEKVSEESFAHSREVFLGFNKLQETKVTLPEIDAELRNYQVQGYKWLDYLHTHNLGGCLADDMGLGKTVQTITLLTSIYKEKRPPSLIVMPKSLIFNWANEFVKFKTNLSYYIYYSNNRDLSDAMKSNIILTTYGMVRNDIEPLKEERFYYVILDESQHIKNVNAQISKAVMLLNSERRLALSGTPIENNLGELYSLFRFLNPSMFGSFDQFNHHYALPIQNREDKEAAKELKKKIYPFVLRRLKKDVLKDLPDKIEQTLFVEMTSAQRNLYEQRRLFYYEAVKTQISVNGIKGSQFFIFQALNELRQIASTPESKSNGQIFSPKRELLIENIQDGVANGHKILVFANFLNSIDNIGTDLKREKIGYLMMTGATRDRKSVVERFQNDPESKVFLLTLKTGGVGLNLTAADTIFIFDPWWNIAAENQAIDRTHRIGQDKTVFSYKLITRNTIEEKILSLQEKKRELFDSVISSDSASIKSLDEKDVEFMLG